ncbi:NAD(P)H-dependent flavin oxidoreductase [Cupriavidus consociatus]|uniref:NAD(P)H-dependent flavin oxidoreductase n=1 Tax=Cupriavidus consociatus TaxID=2821357 RepID=UPI001AE5DE63|nr:MULTISPECIES: nitronate monooxygenase [unclassified Cupriavidus]MBP0620825.1 nitronate monooxygenase [Cupriavidus sp. LEh25]MDK2657485.1 nitronate monooxygenase [Cupriavidus sp. LEh21]
MHSAHTALRATFQTARLPVMAAPMFLVSGPELVCASLSAGIVGTYAAPNARNVEALDAALSQIGAHAAECAGVPWALNMIVHRSYDRFEAEMALVERYRPGIVTTALGSPRRVLDRVHAYGGLVMADVISPALARKAIEAGVDGLLLVTNGAGGHTGQYHPFAFLAEVREFWDGPIGLAGAISTGSQIRAAQLLGADFAVIGTRLIATPESMVSDQYRDLLVSSRMEDLTMSSAVSGVPANWLKPTLESAGFTAEQLKAEARIDFSGDIVAAPKAWKDVWSAGHGVGAVRRVAPVREVVEELEREYLACLRKEQGDISALARRHADRSVTA